MKTKATRIIRKGGVEVGAERIPIVLKPAKRSLRTKAKTFSQDSITFGSSRANDFQIEDDSVSRHHARIDIIDGVLTLIDLDSTNGTWIGGVRVIQGFLPPRGSITLGGFEVSYKLGDEGEAIEVSEQEHFGEFVGSSIAARKLYAHLSRFSASDVTVLLRGESGTGKELLARGVHEASPRSDGPYIIVDCGALPATLIESELFGHIQGAFTGASNNRAGAFELADGGTIFLDEIGELDIALQPKLLRVLENKSVKRVGDSTFKNVDVRVVAATNRDLHKEMARGEFREDLYYRLAVANIEVPPLRHRKDDIPLIARGLLGAMRARYPALTIDDLSDAACSALAERRWAGNVRELRNVLEQAVVTTGIVNHSFAETSAVSAAPADVDTKLPYHHARDAALAAFERAYLGDALDRASGNVAQAARDCNLDRATLFRLIKKHDFKR